MTNRTFVDTCARLAPLACVSVLLLCLSMALNACGDGSQTTTPGAEEGGSAGSESDPKGGRATSGGESGVEKGGSPETAPAGGTSAGAGDEAGAGPVSSGCQSDGDCEAGAPVTSPADCAEARCNTTTSECEYFAKDRDGDGFAASNCISNGALQIEEGLDCDDDPDSELAPNVNPDAEELCNNVDDDCDGQDDDGIEPNLELPCASPAGASDINMCRVAGFATCENGTYSGCSAVAKEPQPDSAFCDGKSYDCDDVPDEECPCTPIGSTSDCATANLGCDGTQTCTLGGWGSCQLDSGANCQCESGASESCSGDQGCPGTHICSGNVWGACACTVTCAESPSTQVLFGTFASQNFGVSGATTLKLPLGFRQRGTVTLPNGYDNSFGADPFVRGSVTFHNKLTGDSYTVLSSQDVGEADDFAIDYDLAVPAGSYELRTTIEWTNDVDDSTSADRQSYMISSHRNDIVVCGDANREVTHTALPTLQSRTVRISGANALGVQALFDVGRLSARIALSTTEVAGDQLTTVQYGSSLADAGNTIVYAFTALPLTSPTHTVTVTPKVIVDALTDGDARVSATNGWEYVHQFAATSLVVGLHNSDAFVTAPALVAADIATLSGTTTDASARLTKAYTGYVPGWPLNEEENIQSVVSCGNGEGYLYQDPLALGYGTPLDKLTCDLTAAYSFRVPFASNAGATGAALIPFANENNFLTVYTKATSTAINASSVVKDFTVPTAGTEVTMNLTVQDNAGTGIPGTGISDALVTVESETALTGVAGHFARTGARSNGAGLVSLHLLAGKYTVTVNAL